MGTSVVASATPDPHPGSIPTAGQVENARKDVANAASQLGRVQARLAAADARRQRLEIAAQVAIEAYDTAVHERTRAEAVARRTSAAAAAARRSVERKRAVVAQVAAATYRLDTGLTEVSAYLDADGPQGLLDQVSTVSMVSTSVVDAYESFRTSRAVARVLDVQAAKALAARQRASAEAATARRRVENALTAQSAAVAAIDSERRALIARRARLERISVRLAAARQEGLEQRARERAERRRRDEERRRRDEERRRRRDDGGGGDRGDRGPGSRQGSVAARFALDQLGEPYVFGADGPGSWDCSGLTMRAWQDAGISMPHFARGQYWQSAHIHRGDLRRGDLIFWATNPSDSDTIHHVAMYLGDGQMVHAPRPGRSVEIRSMWYMGAPTHYARPR